MPWIDGFAGLSAGLLVLALRGVLADFYGVSVAFLTFNGAVNVGYSLLGLTLGPMRRRSRALLYVLIAANLLWAGVCVVLALRVAATASVFGLAHIVGEGLFVTGLAVLELRHREEILAPAR